MGARKSGTGARVSGSFSNGFPYLMNTKSKKEAKKHDFFRKNGLWDIKKQMTLTNLWDYHDNNNVIISEEASWPRYFGSFNKLAMKIGHQSSCLIVSSKFFSGHVFPLHIKSVSNWQIYLETIMVNRVPHESSSIKRGRLKSLNMQRCVTSVVERCADVMN